MAYKLNVKEIVLSERNDNAGIFQFTVTFSNQSKCRISYSRQPEWKITNVNRLLNNPCPICYKDYYCNCLNKLTDEFEQQITPEQYL